MNNPKKRKTRQSTEYCEKILTKEFLYKEIFLKNKTKQQISKEVNICKYTIQNFCNKFDIRKYYPRGDLSGKKFGKLNVLNKTDKRDKSGDIIYECKCDCGNLHYVNSGRLRYNGTLSCGCEANRIGIHSQCWNGYGGLSGTTFCYIKRNAKARNLKFSLTKKYLWELFETQKGKCALSGLNIEFGRKFSKKTKDKKEQTASLDRIDSSKGYIEGNVQWVHKDINRIKSDFLLERFLELCKLVTEHNRK